MSSAFKALGARHGRPEHRLFHAVAKDARYAVCGWKVPKDGYVAEGTTISCPKCAELLQLGQAEQAAEAAARAASDQVDKAVATTAAPKPTPAGMRASLDLILEAADQVYERWLDYGPVDDGRPEGEKFEEGLIWLGGVANYLRNLHKNEPAPG